MEYAELFFPPSTAGGTVERRVGGVHVAVASSTLGRKGSMGRGRRGQLPAPASASMQQLPRASRAPESENSESNYTEIIGVLQPKAYTSQLVLKQQQEATQALLAMNTNGPPVDV